MMGVTVERGRLRMASAISKPLMPGMCTSSSITANSRCSRRRRASWPESTPTTSIPRGSSMAVRLSSWSWRSLTTSTASLGGVLLSLAVFMESSDGMAFGVAGALAVEPVLAGDGFVTVGIRGTEDGLAGAQAQHAVIHQAAVQQRMDARAQVVVEIDHHVAAQDQVELVEGAV